MKSVWSVRRRVVVFFGLCICDEALSEALEKRSSALIETTGELVHAICQA